MIAVPDVNHLIVITHRGEHGPVECATAAVPGEQPESFVRAAAAMVKTNCEKTCKRKHATKIVLAGAK